MSPWEVRLGLARLLALRHLEAVVCLVSSSYNCCRKTDRICVLQFPFPGEQILEWG